MRWLSAIFVIAITIRAPQTSFWGGDHVRMTVTAAGADLEFDCAAGTITETVPETNGSFSLKGTFTPQHGGPIRRDEPSRTTAAVYSGAIDGDSMTLHVVLESDGQEVGKYVLARGSAGAVRKCR
jgi:hypothetical protein